MFKTLVEPRAAGEWFHCQVTQYTGETKRRLKDRFNEHRRPVVKQTNKQTILSVQQSQKILFLTTIKFLTCYLFLSNSSNLIVSMCAEQRTPEIKSGDRGFDSFQGQRFFFTSCDRPFPY